MTVASRIPLSFMLSGLMLRFVSALCQPIRLRRPLFADFMVSSACWMGLISSWTKKKDNEIGNSKIWKILPLSLPS